jgi:hypothetical protein
MQEVSGLQLGVTVEILLLGIMVNQCISPPLNLLHVMLA